MEIVRKENWSTILNAEIENSKTLEFKYGTNDCTIWSYKVVSAYTNIKWAPTWKNKKEALLQQQEEPMEDQVSRVLGKLPRGNIYNTKRGDVVQKGRGMDAALGVCIGRKVVFLKENRGICFISLDECTFSWRI